MSEPLPLLWCDIETTGLDFEHDALMELACFTTDPQGNNRRPTFSWVIGGSNNHYIRLKLAENVFVQDMHTISGLVEACNLSELDFDDFERGFFDYLSGELAFYETEKLTMAGSGVGPFDLPYLKSWMPDLDKFLTYYVMDVGVIGRFFRNVCGFKLDERPAVNHRASDDINDHYNEFLEYKKLMQY